MAWHWEKVGAALVARPMEWAGVLNTRMKALEHQLGFVATGLTVDGTAYTTDATVTTLRSFAIPVSTSLLVSGFVVARRTGGSAGSAHDGAGYAIQFLAKNAAGTAALIGSLGKTVIGESQAGWDVTAAASSGNILLQVTGAANNDVTWVWVGQSVGVDDRS